LLLIFQVAANIGIFAIIVPALVQFIILLPVQAVDLVIEIDFEFSTGIWHFGLARVQENRHSEQEGPDYKGMLVHTKPPRHLYLAPSKASLPVLIYEERLRKLLSGYFAAKHATSSMKKQSGDCGSGNE
jgi:hypothetical protein